MRQLKNGLIFVLFNSYMHRLLLILFLNFLFYPFFGQELSELDFELIKASEKADSAKVVQSLKNGANVNAEKTDGTTALMFACDNNSISIVKVLLDYGADPNIIPDISLTALHSAAINGNWEIGELLIKHGAKINQPNNSGITPLHLATYYKNFYFVDMLIFYGANCNAQDNEGYSPLVYATFIENIDIVDLLIKNGADINLIDNKGNTVLMTAISKQNIEIVKILIENGAVINYLNNDHICPLNLAVVTGIKELCDLLVKNGADVTSDFIMNRDLYFYAKNRIIKEYLKEIGIKRDYKMIFNKFELNVCPSFNNKDIYLGFGTGLHEAKYNFNIEAGYAFRPWVRAVLINRKDDAYWQYWEKRSVYWLGASKDFKVLLVPNKKEFGFNLGVKTIYTTSKFFGTKINTAPFYTISPSLGLYKKKEFISFYLKYEYIDLKLYSFPKYWLTCIFAVRFNIDKNYKALKQLIKDF